MGAAFGSSGERCMAVSVVVAIGDETADALIEAFRAEIVKLKVGSFDNANNDFGPLISDEHRDRVVSLINSAEKAGASIIVDGRKPELAAGDDGFFEAV